MKKRLLSLLLLCTFLLYGCTAATPTTTQKAPETGGSVKLAWTSQPPTLDTHVTTTNVVRDIARPIYENLVTFDADYKVIPMLADSYKESEDRKTITFILRKGVKFHNGKEMKAADIISSMEKWTKQNKVAQAELGKSTWEAKDDYTVILHVETPKLSILYSLADLMQTASIMPKEVADAADSKGVKEYIGTGPFMFSEWKQDQYIHLKKFPDYSASSAPTNGLGGKKVAMVDDLYFYFVPEDSTRLNGIISGEYDYASEVPFDNIEQLRKAPNLVTDVWQFGFQTLIFNKKGIFKDLKLRQAVNHAINKTELLSLAFIDKQFYSLEPSFMRPQQKAWYNDGGKDIYNVYDLEKAKQLLKDAGYKGEPVTILTSSDYKYHYDSALVTKEALEKIGMTVKLDVTDWATLMQRRTDPAKWDIFFTAFTTVATPLSYPFLDSKVNYPGWTNNPKIDQLLAEIRTSQQDVATVKYKELQQLVWEDLPVINVGMTNRISGYSKKLSGYSVFMGPIFWNMSISK